MKKVSAVDATARQNRALKQPSKPEVVACLCNTQGAANIDAKVRAIIADVETIARARMTRTSNGSGTGEVPAGAEANKAA